MGSDYSAKKGEWLKYNSSVWCRKRYVRPLLGSERLCKKKETQSAKKTNKIVVRYLPLLPWYSTKSAQNRSVLGSLYISAVIIWSDLRIF